MSKENSSIDWDKVINLYKEGYGTSYIGKQFNVPSNSIRRGLIKRGAVLRTKAEAQKLALEIGVANHPTEGKGHSIETKHKLAKATHDTWENKSDDEKKKISKRSKENWENRSEEDKQDMYKKAARAIRKAAEEGSALEKFFLKKIRESGYEVQWHASSTLQQEKLEIDLLLPSLKIAIEVDGPFHSQVIYTKEQFSKTVSADKTKNGLLLAAGYCVIRVRSVKKNTSNYMFEEGWKKLKLIIEDIIKKFPVREDRFIEITVE